MLQIAFDRMCVSDFSHHERRRGLTSTMGVCVCLFLAALMCCAFSDVRSPIVLTSANNGTAITVSHGTQFVVQLADNSGSTGYAWNFVAQSNNVVALQSTTYQAAVFAPGSRPRVGAAGTVQFTFVAQNIGIASLKFVLRRSWETGIPAAQRFGVMIHVSA